MYRFHHTIKGDRSLPVILFLHGFLGDSRDFESITEKLSERFCCLAVDLPGHGQTIVDSENELYTMPNTASALVDWLDQINIPPCAIAGYSMGGRLALYLAIHFADRFPQVILVSASPGLKSETERQARLQHDWRLADQLEADFPAFLDNWYRQPLFQALSQSPGFEQMVKRRSHNQPTELAKSLRYLSTGKQPSLWDCLNQHKQPLLLIVGERDRKFCQINQEIVERCPTAHLSVIAQSGHAVHLEQPEALTFYIQNFLD